MKKLIGAAFCLAAICCAFTGCDSTSDSNTANYEDDRVNRADLDNDGALERGARRVETAVETAVKDVESGVKHIVK